MIDREPIKFRNIKLSSAETGSPASSKEPDRSLNFCKKKFDRLEFKITHKLLGSLLLTFLAQARAAA
jgi:hypothetical protein